MPLVHERMSLDAYLALDESDGVKVEWVNGEAYAMSGGRPIHAAVTLNTSTALFTRLRGQSCRPSSSDRRLHVPETGAYFFPDVMVICPPWETVLDDVQSVTNPALIVEVLSPSTVDYDRGGKLEHYRRISSLRDYLLIDTASRTTTPALPGAGRCGM